MFKKYKIVVMYNHRDSSHVMFLFARTLHQAGNIVHNLCQSGLLHAVEKGHWEHVPAKNIWDRGGISVYKV